MVSKEKSIFIIGVTILFFGILLIPVDVPPVETKFTSSTRTDWGYSVEYCNDIWGEPITTRIDENTVQIKWIKTYCSI